MTAYDTTEPPRLPAVTITPEVGDPRHVVVWCPWCEALHWHGAAGGGSNRAPHCAEDRHSPFGPTGYDLDIVGHAASERAIVPAGLLVGQRRLHQVAELEAAARTERHITARARALEELIPQARVRIVDGPFRSFSGRVVELMLPDRVMISVKLFGSEHPVPMEIGHVELAKRNGP